MSYAPDFNPSNSFADDESNQAAGRSTVRTAPLDSQFAAISTSINTLNTNLKLLQRDDGQLRDFVINAYAMSEALRAMLVAAGKNIRGEWAQDTDYQIGDLVQRNAVAYICQTAHNSGASFNLGLWLAISGDGAAQAWAEVSQAAQTIASSAANTATAAAASAVSAAASALSSQIAAASSALAAQNAANSVAALAPVNLSAYMLGFLANNNAANARTTLGAVSSTALASTASASDGAGIPKFSALLPYAADSAGGAIKAAVSGTADAVVAGGTANALTATLTHFPSAYAQGCTVRFEAASTNTAAATLNVNSIGAVNLVDQLGVRVTAGQLVAGQVYTAVYNGAAFVLQGSAQSSAVRRGPRSVIQYGSATSVIVRETAVQMAGFRFMGGYSKTYAPTYPTPAQSNTVSTSTQLGAESSVAVENWYAVFACANDGDSSASFRLMPFLRAGSVASSVITLNQAGEGVHSVAAKTYSWSATNNLAGTECLVISEGGNHSGRVTTITANTGTTATLASIGTVAAYDFLLPAPPGFSQFCYLGCFYFDTAEVRNLYDSGSLVKTKSIFIAQPSASLTGSVPSPGVQFNASGYISPLATAVEFDSTCVLSTASTGTFIEYFDPDGGAHVVHTTELISKQTTGNQSVVSPRVCVPFLYPQKFHYLNSGSLAGSRINGQFNITGWIEP